MAKIKEQTNPNLPKRKHRLIRFLMIAAILVLIWWINNYSIRTQRLTITSEKLSDEIKIVLISDLHGAEFGADNSRLTKLINAEQADFVACVGDMATHGDEVGMRTAEDFLATIEAPVYFVSGDHDRDTDYINEISDEGVHVLLHENESSSFSCAMETLTVGSTELDICGIGYSSRTYAIEDYLTRDEERFTLLLGHNVRPEQFAAFGADLTLSGDTHGGMFRFFGPVMIDNVWFPKLTTNETVYDKGLFPCGDGQLFITSGLGDYPYPIRFCNRPEIVVITLAPEA